MARITMNSVEPHATLSAGSDWTVGGLSVLQARRYPGKQGVTVAEACSRCEFSRYGFVWTGA